MFASTPPLHREGAEPPEATITPMRPQIAPAIKGIGETLSLPVLGTELVEPKRFFWRVSSASKAAAAGQSCKATMTWRLVLGSVSNTPISMGGVVSAGGMTGSVGNGGYYQFTNVFAHNNLGNNFENPHLFFSMHARVTVTAVGNTWDGRYRWPLSRTIRACCGWPSSFVVQQALNAEALSGVGGLRACKPNANHWSQVGEVHKFRTSRGRQT